jgi:MFS-type transporter involved in bile tolerance (Atg22 family)
VTDLSPADAMGTAMGVYRTIGDAGFFVGSVLLGGLVDVTATPQGGMSHWPFTVAAVWLIVSGLLLLTARDPSGERARARAPALGTVDSRDPK